VSLYDSYEFVIFSFLLPSYPAFEAATFVLLLPVYHVNTMLYHNILKSTSIAQFCTSFYVFYRKMFTNRCMKNIKFPVTRSLSATLF